MRPESAHIDVLRVASRQREVQADRAAVEEPLEVRLAGRPFAVVMRTPGADRELAAGFLLSEGVLESAEDLGTIEHCKDARKAENVVNVTLLGGPDRVARAFAGRRNVTMNSSCGMCGRLSIESLTVDRPRLTCDRVVSAEIVASMPESLRARQTVFAETGGLHAAGLFSFDGTLEIVTEDVGRHNAVDKIIGRMLMMDRLPLSDSILFVSGRTSFEIVQKAFVAGIPLVAAVSAASSLAIDLAREAGITLVGFVRAGSFNVYAHPDRIR